MFPWMMPNATMGGQLSLLSMLGGGQGQGQQAYGWGAPSWMQGLAGSRSDQTDQGNARDGNVMDPCGSRNQQGINNPRTALGLGMLGLNMMQPRPYGR